MVASLQLVTLVLTFEGHGAGSGCVLEGLGCGIGGVMTICVGTGVISKSIIECSSSELVPNCDCSLSVMLL